MLNTKGWCKYVILIIVIMYDLIAGSYSFRNALMLARFNVVMDYIVVVLYVVVARSLRRPVLMFGGAG